MRNTNSVYALEIEFVHKVNVFVLKMMVKSGLEKNILKIPPFARHFLVIHFTS